MRVFLSALICLVMISGGSSLGASANLQTKNTLRIQINQNYFRVPASADVDVTSLADNKTKDAEYLFKYSSAIPVASSVHFQLSSFCNSRQSESIDEICRSLKGAADNSIFLLSVNASPQELFLSGVFGDPTEIYFERNKINVDGLDIAIVSTTGGQSFDCKNPAFLSKTRICHFHFLVSDAILVTLRVPMRVIVTSEDELKYKTAAYEFLMSVREAKP